jgi:hypothetical protein
MHSYRIFGSDASLKTSEKTQKPAKPYSFNFELAGDTSAYETSFVQFQDTLFNDGSDHCSDFGSAVSVLQEEVVHPAFFCDFAVHREIVTGKNVYDQVWIEIFDLAGKFEKGSHSRS